jgi:hypothetical protein
MSINTGATLPHVELRVRIVDNGCRETQEFARFPQADTLEPRPGANLDSSVAQLVNRITCCWVSSA